MSTIRNNHVSFLIISLLTIRMRMGALMPTPYEPTRSFCYRFARYDVLNLIAQEPEAITGEPFRLINVATRVIEGLLTQGQLSVEVPAAQADHTDSIFSIIKFFTALLAKRLPNSPFIWRGQGGMYQLKQENDFEREMVEVELDAEEDDIIDDVAAEFDGWIYAFSFPTLVKINEPFPIKIGMTRTAIDERIDHQCKGAASFDNPVILGRWQVKKVGAFEKTIHCILKTRGKWRDNVPGKEWFDTTLTEIESIIRFIPSTEVGVKDD